MSVNDISGIVIDDSRVTLQIVASLTDDSRNIIYECKMFILTGHRWQFHEYFNCVNLQPLQNKVVPFENKAESMNIMNRTAHFAKAISYIG
jgi:hypothetical protein